MSFNLTAEQLKSDGVLLIFEGLDTHADVFLNGARILQTQNMFVGHQIPVKNSLRAGENNLFIRFYSPVKRMEPARLTAGYEYPAGNDHSDKKVSIFNRKAPYQFGWDWGIRLVQIGIWKPITLQLYNKANIDNFYVKQISLNKEKAVTDNQIEIYSIAETPVKISTGALFNNLEVQSVSKEIILKKGKNTIAFPYHQHPITMKH